MSIAAKNARAAEQAAADLLQDEFGVLARKLNTPANRARADAEWNAMDCEGRLPDGWKYEARK